MLADVGDRDVDALRDRTGREREADARRAARDDRDAAGQHLGAQLWVRGQRHGAACECEQR